MAQGQRRVLERYLKQVRAFCSCSSLRNNALGPPSILLVERVTEDLLGLLHLQSSYGRPTSIWAAIGDDRLAGLVSLYALALRRSVVEDSSPSERVAYGDLRAAMAAHLGRLYQDYTSNFLDVDLYDTVSEALVRTDTTQSYVALLAGVASEINMSPQPGPRHLGLKAVGVLREAVSLLEVLLLPDGAGRRGEKYEMLTMMVGLQQIHFMEHFARALLQASRCKGTRTEVAALMHQMTPVLASRLAFGPLAFRCGEHSISYLVASHLYGLAAALDGGGTYGMPSGPGVAAAPVFSTSGWPLRLHSSGLADARLACLALYEWEEVLANMVKYIRPHARGFSSSFLIVAASRLPELQRRLAELQALTASLQARDARQDLSLESMNTERDLEFVEQLLSEWRAPLFKVAATRDVCMRLAVSARDSLLAAAAGAAAGEGAEQEPEQLGQPHQQQPRLSPRHAAELGLRALHCARAALWNVGWAPEADTPAPKREQLERWWSLVSSFIPVAATLRPEPEKGGSWQRIELYDLLALRTKSIEEPWPAGPSLDVAIALREGFLQLLELLLRRRSTAGDGAQPFDGRQDRQVEASDTLKHVSKDSWAQVLGFGAPGEVASLAATVAKAMRRATLQLESAAAAVRTEFAAAGINDSEFTRNSISTRSTRSTVTLFGARTRLADAQEQAREVANFVQRVLDPGDGRSPAPFMDCLLAGAAGSEAPGASSRLASGLAQLAVRVLPEVTPLIGGLEGGWGQMHDDVSSCTAIIAALSWVPLIAAAGLKSDGGSRHGAKHGAGYPAVMEAAGATARAVVTTAPLAVVDASQEASAAAVPSAAVAGLAADVTAPAEAEEAAAPAAASAAAAASAWDRWLWVDVRLAELLGLALRMVGVMRSQQSQHAEVEEAWVRAMWALVDFAPSRLGGALNSCVNESRGIAAVDAGWGADTDARARRRARYELTMPRLRGALGPEGYLPRPELLAALERVVLQSPSRLSASAAPEAAGEGTQAGEAVPAEARSRAVEEGLRGWVAMAALLPAPGEVLAVLPTCANPLCTNLKGDSEAALKLSGCGRCGGRVRYCCRECQVAHWKAGHKGECGKEGQHS